MEWNVRFVLLWLRSDVSHALHNLSLTTNRAFTLLLHWCLPPCCFCWECDHLLQLYNNTQQQIRAKIGYCWLCWCWEPKSSKTKSTAAAVKTGVVEAPPFFFCLFVFTLLPLSFAFPPFTHQPSICCLYRIQQSRFSLDFHRSAHVYEKGNGRRGKKEEIAVSVIACSAPDIYQLRFGTQHSPRYECTLS
jgi:hypothetical protein